MGHYSLRVTTAYATGHYSLRVTKTYGPLPPAGHYHPSHHQATMTSNPKSARARISHFVTHILSSVFPFRIGNWLLTVGRRKLYQMRQIRLIRKRSSGYTHCTCGAGGTRQGYSNKTTTNVISEGRVGDSKSLLLSI